LHHYASLADFYTVYDMRRMKPEQANLYLLCYAWQRFGQLTVAACHGRGTIPWAVSTPVQPSGACTPGVAEVFGGLHPLLGGLAWNYLETYIHEFTTPTLPFSDLLTRKRE